MSVMEIISNLGLLYMGLIKSRSNGEIDQELDILLENQLIAIKKAIQILISVDLKREMEQQDG